MKIWSNSFANGSPIPGQFAFSVPDAAAHVRLSDNRNPHLAWDGVPAGTKSFVLICHDPDVPSRGDSVNQEGKTVPADLPRIDFFHWTLINLPLNLREIAEGEFADGVTPHGKAGPDTGHTGLAGAQHGLNDYTSWFAGDKDMGGFYYGYDGPCPPWNDSLVHRYIFTLYALDVSHLNLGQAFKGQQVRAALSGHVLAKADLMGTYTLNPALAGAPSR